jgi:hypothetical protein
LGSSILIRIATIIKIGEKIKTQRSQAQKSKILLNIFDQLFKGVFFISITGKLFIKDKVVFVFVTSKEFVIYL